MSKFLMLKQVMHFIHQGLIFSSANLLAIGSSEYVNILRVINKVLSPKTVLYKICYVFPKLVSAIYNLLYTSQLYEYKH